jgi:signal peptidase II
MDARALGLFKSVQRDRVISPRTRAILSYYTNMTRHFAFGIGLLASVAGLVGCDHATKALAQANLQHHAPVVLVPGVIDLGYTENRDIAFSVFSHLRLAPPAWALGTVALLTMVAIFVAWMRRGQRPWLEHAAFAMILAGAIGNALDRLVSGRVVDFIHIHFWPVFNIADVLIVAGVALLLLLGRRRPLAPTP